MIIDSVMGWIYGAEFDVRSYVKDFSALLMGKHRKPLAEYSGATPINLNGKKIAVVAIHPGSKAADFSLINLLKSLQVTGFQVLMVSTLKLSKIQREKFGTHCNHVIERHGIGRDFGSYQMGLNWLEEKGYLKSAEYLILANDSLFYPVSFADHVGKLIEADRPWAGLFENFEMHYHSQSFFQMFKPETFNSVAFRKFWRQYWPFSTRAHAIDRGEIRFSSVLIKAGIPQYTLFRSDVISHDVIERLKGPVDDNLVLAIKHTLNLTEVARRNYGEIELKHQRDGGEALLTISPQSLAQSITAEAEFSNPTHRVGLICNVLYNAPFKRDMTYRGSIEIGTLLINCRGFSDVEKQMIREDLVARGVPQSLKANRRLLSLFRSSRI
jgi:hypothetical protein